MQNGEVGDSLAGVSTIEYNFRDDYGFDPYGNQLHNLITPVQQERAREVLQLLSNYLGVQFVETPPLPAAIVRQTAKRYLDIYKRLTGRDEL